MRRLLLAIMVFMVSAAHSGAQDHPQYRMEIGAGVGMLTYEGDFNGNLFRNVQPMGTIIGRYNLDAYKVLRLGFSMGKIKGSSKNVETYYPDYELEPYSFNHMLMDMSLVFEYNFWPYGTGRDYRGAKRLTPFVFGGLGATFVKGSGKNVFTGNVPLGFGVKYKVAERVNVALDWAIHFSLSDDLDGVKDPYGIKSSGLFKNTDCYSALQATITYSFRPKCRTCYKE